MALISDELRLLFICVPKTGSTSIAQFLTEHYKARWLPSDHIWNKTRERIVVDYKHSSLESLLQHGLITRQELKRYQVAAVTRNPFDWVLSKYRYHHKVYQTYRGASAGKLPDWLRGHMAEVAQTAGMTFERYVITHYSRLANCSVHQRYITLHTGEAAVDLLRFESLQNDFERLIWKTAGTDTAIRLPLTNMSRPTASSWHEYYSPAARHIIEEAFQDDLARLNYHWREVAPVDTAQ